MQGARSEFEDSAAILRDRHGRVDGTDEKRLNVRGPEITSAKV